MVPEFITGGVICARFGISRWTWRRWVRSGIAPEPARHLPGQLKWRVEEIERFANGSQCRYFKNSGLRRSA